MKLNILEGNFDILETERMASHNKLGTFFLKMIKIENVVAGFFFQKHLFHAANIQISWLSLSHSNFHTFF